MDWHSPGSNNVVCARGRHVAEMLLPIKISLISFWPGSAFRDKNAEKRSRVLIVSFVSVRGNLRASLSFAALLSFVHHGQGKVDAEQRSTQAHGLFGPHSADSGPMGRCLDDWMDGSQPCAMCPSKIDAVLSINKPEKG